MVKKCLFYHSAIIEHVRDGSVVRALLLPGHHLVTVMLSGIKVRPHTQLHSGFGVCGVFVDGQISLLGEYIYFVLGVIG